MPIGLESVQVLAQVVLHVQIPPVAQKVLDHRGKFGVEIARKAVARVIRKDAHEHDRVILDMVRSAVRSGKVFADEMGGLLCGGGTRFGSLDDLRKVDEFISLL